MKKVVVFIGILLCAMMVCSSCSKDKPRQCKCKINWVNPNAGFSQEAINELMGMEDYWWANAGEPCSKIPQNINNEYYTYVCVEQ